MYMLWNRFATYYNSYVTLALNNLSYILCSVGSKIPISNIVSHTQVLSQFNRQQCSSKTRTRKPGIKIKRKHRIQYIDVMLSRMDNLHNTLTFDLGTKNEIL